MAPSRCSSLVVLLLLGPTAITGVKAARTALKVTAVSGSNESKISRESKTAYKLLCDARLGMRKWIENPCGMFSPTCQKLDFKCDGDSRVEDLTISWHQDTLGLGSLSNLLGPRTGWSILDSISEKIGSKMTFKIKKDLTPVEAPPTWLFKEHVTRYFLQSFGCDDPKEECFIPWPGYEAVRSEGQAVGITRFYLAYREEVPGHPETRIEIGQWATDHLESNFTFLGTGVEPPPALVFAGSVGTGCVGGASCDEPENHGYPVPFREFEVTTHHLMEHPQGSGLYQLRNNTNRAVQEETVVHKFKESH